MMISPSDPSTDLRDQLQLSLGHAYSLERELGGGGMSRVFVATETALARKVVVKVLPAELAGGVSADRFNREIHLAARLQHPNIVPLLSAGDAAGVPFYTMPLVEGESLRARLQRTGELAVKQAVAILRDVARALDYAHTHGVAHRDIKPDNVLLSGDYAVVMDFGVAKALMAARSGTETLTGLGVAIGTPAYMSPEQAAGDTSDQRSDLYAFGCMAYEMLTGAPPFHETSAPALFSAHATRAPVPLADVRPAVPPPLASLVMRCLEKRPADRPQSAREIIETLDAVSTPVSGSSTFVGRASETLIPKRVMVGIAAVIVAAVALGAWMLLRPGRATVDAGVVAVTPFRVAGADASLRTLREGMLDLISAKLSGTTRAVDPRTVLSGWRKRGGSETSDLTRDQSLTLASSLGAGRLLEGEIVGTPQRLVISASLVAVPGGDPRATARVMGEYAQLPLLVDSLMSELLVREAGESETQARRLAGIPFDAIQAFLAGQAAYRKGRYESAVEYFDRALDFDSTFALAAIQLHLADSWVTTGRGARGTRLALQQYDRLGARERLLLNGDDPLTLRGRVRPAADAKEVAERAAAAAPDVPETWYFLGDALMHYGWVTTMGEDPWRRAVVAFERALELDSSFAPAREHLVMLYSYTGDSARARHELAAMNADSSDFVEINRMALGAISDSVERRRVADRLIDRHTSVARLIPAVLGLYAVQYVADGEYALARLQRDAATDVQRTRLANIEWSLALDFGQPHRAAAAGRRAQLAAPTVLLAATFWDADTSAVAAARDTALRAYDMRPRPEELERWAGLVFAAAQFELGRRDTMHAPRAIALLRGYVPPDDQPWLTERPRALATILDAQLAGIARRPDAVRALASADSVVRHGLPGAIVIPVGALIVARLQEQRGDMNGAYASIRRIAYIDASRGPSFYSTYRLAHARIAAAIGEREEAMRAYRAWIAMRENAEPELRAQVAEVKKELARLVSRAQ